MESLLLFRRALSSPTMCRFIPALSVLPFLSCFFCPLASTQPDLPLEPSPLIEADCFF